jgi:glycerol uptake facilitator-like aquaporin
MRAVYATANVSGGHVNPAVTLANCLTGHMSWGRGGLYMVAQLLGGIFGALIEVCSIQSTPYIEDAHAKMVPPVCRNPDRDCAMPRTAAYSQSNEKYISQVSGWDMK